MRPFLLTLIILSAYLAWAPATLAATIIRAPNNLDLVGYWPMNEGRGTKVGDMSGNGNHGTIAGNPQWASGIRGGALDFDGSDDEVSLPSLALTTDGTISGWFYWDSSDNTGASLIRDNTGSGGWLIGWNNGGNLSYRAGGTTFFSGVSPTPYQNRWTHYVVTKSGANVALYLDGVSVHTSGSAANTASQSPWHVMRNGTIVDYLKGKVDDIRIYSRALTATEVTALYNSGAARLGATPKGPTNGLVGHWTFDGPTVSTTTVNDISGNANHGTISGNAAPTLGKIGQGFTFDGSGDYLSIAANPTGLTGSDNFTMSAWLNSGSSTLRQVVFQNGNGDFSSGGNAAQRVVFGFGDSLSQVKSTVANGSFISHNSAVASRNEWIFMVVTYNPSTGSHNLYVNGVLADSDNTISGNVFDESDWSRIGSGLNRDYFNGDIDDVRIYNRVLSTEEIYRLYTLGR